MQQMTKKRLLKFIAAVIILTLLSAFVRYAGKQKNLRIYNNFYNNSYVGKITAVDAGRGTKIAIDTYDDYILFPSYRCTNCKENFTFETGENLGDFLIKKAQSDSFEIKKSSGIIMTFKISNY